MNAYDVLINRRSIRKYTQSKISDKLLEKIVQAGLSAPSAKNMQPCEFVVVTDRDTLDRLSDIRPYWKMLKTAPASIVTLANLSVYEPDASEMYVQDCSAATENMLLAAESLGLGGVWLGLYPHERPMQDVQALFGIPKNVIPISVISIGHPDEKRPPHGDFAMQKVHYNRY